MTTSELRRDIERCATGDPVVEGRTVSRTFRLDDAFLGFAGHFPGYPVLPGFVQLVIAAALAETCNGPMRLLAVETAKYHVQIHPGREIAVTCSCRTAERGEVVDAAIRLGGETASAFVLLVDRTADA